MHLAIYLHYAYHKADRQMPAKKTAENFRLTDQAREFLRQIAEQEGQNKTQAIEALIRKEARERGLKIRSSGEKRK